MGSNQILKIISGVAVVTALLVCGFVFVEARKTNENVSTLTAPDTVISYENLPQGSVIKATLLQSGKVTDLQDTGSAFVLSEEQKKGFALPYSIKAIVKSGDVYRDFSWDIDSRGVAHNILIDGFRPEDTVTFSMNDQEVYTIPFDWSGRIELSSMMIVGVNSKPCFSIHEDGKSYGFCHFILGRKAA